MPRKTVYNITIPKDKVGENGKKEQYKVFQRDGNTIQVPIGRSVEVPEWVAKRAVEIGVIEDYASYEVDA